MQRSDYENISEPKGFNVLLKHTSSLVKLTPRDQYVFSIRDVGPNDLFNLSSYIDIHTVIGLVWSNVHPESICEQQSLTLYRYGTTETTQHVLDKYM